MLSLSKSDLAFLENFKRITDNVSTKNEVELISDTEFLGYLHCGFSCYGSCSGTCDSSCRGGCSSSCRGTCSLGCYSSCDSSCKGRCDSSCKGTCSNSCYRTCDSSCKGSCDSSCKGTCDSNCKGSCKTSCYGTCDGGSKGKRGSFQVDTKNDSNENEFLYIELEFEDKIALKKELELLGENVNSLDAKLLELSCQ